MPARCRRKIWKNYKVAEREPARQLPRLPNRDHAAAVIRRRAPDPDPEHDGALAHGPANSAKSCTTWPSGMKLAYADRAEYLGDPDPVKVPPEGLTSKRYAESAGQDHQPHAGASAQRDIKPGKPQPYESDQTTHYSVVDKAGNAVAVTYTLNTNFGSGIVAKGTGHHVEQRDGRLCRQARRGQRPRPGRRRQRRAAASAPCRR